MSVEPDKALLLMHSARIDASLLVSDFKTLCCDNIIIIVMRH